LIGAIVDQDVSGLEAKDNNSALYRIGNSKDIPAGAEVIVQPGGDISNARSLKYWAMDQANVQIHSFTTAQFLRHLLASAMTC